MDLVDTSSPADHDDLTMVIPGGSSQNTALHGPFMRSRPSPAKTASGDYGTAPNAEDDGFTMVIPNTKASLTQARSPIASPEKARRVPERAQTDTTTINSPNLSPEQVKHSSADSTHSPSRRGSPVRQTGEVHVFEDEPVGRPLLVANRSTPPSPEKTPLEELPINDRGSGRSPSPENDSKVSSPYPANNDVMDATYTVNGTGSQTSQDRAETVRARRLLASGIERIKARTLDAHGFRRLQELVKSPNADIWIPFAASTELESSLNKAGGLAIDSPRTRGSTTKLADLLLALASYIELPLSTLSPHQAKAANLKGQALSIATALLVQPHFPHALSGYAQAQSSRKVAQVIGPRVLCAILRARKECDDVSHLAAELERAATEIVGCCETLESIEAVLDVMDTEESSAARRSEEVETGAGKVEKEQRVQSDSAGHARIASMGLDILSQLLRQLKPRKTALSAERRQRLGQAAVRFLEDPEPDVRRADTDFCVELYDFLLKTPGPDVAVEGEDTTGTEEFWHVVSGAGEGSLNLITYYLAKRGKA